MKNRPAARPARFDAPFWLVLTTGVLFLGAVGFLGLAAAAESVSSDVTTTVLPADPT